MYIWAAVDVDGQLAEQKETVKGMERAIGFRQSNVSLLPLHISLKGPGEVPARQEASLREDIAALLREAPAFAVEIEGIERSGSILWIKMKENEPLRRLHVSLCELFEEKYGIMPHPYDDCFLFHTTLFLDPDAEKLEEAYARIRDMRLPATITANRFFIGSSPDASFGSYRVDTVIEKPGK